MACWRIAAWGEKQSIAERMTSGSGLPESRDQRRYPSLTAASCGLGALEGSGHWGEGEEGLVTDRVLCSLFVN